MHKRGRKGFGIVSIILAVVTFLAAGAAGYIFASPRIEKSDLKQEASLPALPDESETYFSKFTKKLLEDIEQEDKSFGIKADINKFDISYLGKDGVNNNSITAEGNINFLTKNLDEFSFTADLDVNYNNKDINLALGYVDECFYFELQDIRLKSSISDISQIKEYISNWFFNPENEKGFGIPFEFEALLNILPGLVNIDLSGLTGDGGSFATTEKEYDTTTEIVSFEVSNVCIDLFIDKESLALKNVNINSEKKDALNLDVKLGLSSVEKVLSFEDAEYPKRHEKFVEVISYLSWCDNLVDLFNNKKLGLDLGATVLDSKNEKICSVESKLDFDFDGVFDFKDINFNDINSIKDKINLDNVEFNIGASLSGREEREYSNLNLAYTNKTSYLTLNEAKDKTAFLRAKCDTESMIEIVNHISDLIIELSGKDIDLSNVLDKKETSRSIGGTFDFITSSEIIAAIRNNDFSAFVDVVNSITHDEKSIKVNFDLSKLNLGDKASVEFSINDKIKTQNHVIELSVNNLEIADCVLNLKLNPRDFSRKMIDYARNNSSKFDDLAPLKGAVDQFSDVIQSKSAKISLTGKLTSNLNKYDYYDLKGTTQISIDEGNAFGSIELVRSIARKNETTHLVNFELTNELENTLYLIYNNKLKGKININSILGVVDVIKPLLGGSDNVSLDSFTSKIETSALIGAISNVLESKDYLAFTRPTFVKSITFKSDKLIEIVIPKEAFNLNGDIVLNLNLIINQDGTKELENISVSNLNLGDKKLEFSLGISRPDESFVSKINKKDSSFLDFNSLKLLTKLGVNLIDNGYIHLGGNIGVSIDAGILGKFNLTSINLDVHIVIEDSGLKVYFVLPNFEYGNKTIKCEIAFEQTASGGLVHILRNINGSSDSYYYRADLDFFIEHIVQYISVCLFNRVLINKTVSKGSSGSSQYENIFAENGFSYILSNNVPTWNLNLNLSALIGNDSLGAASVVLKGSGEDNGVINFVSLSTTLVGVVNIGATLSLQNDCLNTDNWSNSVEARYNSIINCAGDSSVTKNLYGENDGFIVHL